MISEKQAYSYCCEDISKIENYDKAMVDTTHTWHCHHRDEIKVLPSGMNVIRSKQDLIDDGRYYNCPANELIFLTRVDHAKIHNSGKTLSAEHKVKISDACKGKGKIHSLFGTKFKEHFGIRPSDNLKLYNGEYNFFRTNGYCRWEKDTWRLVLLKAC